MAAYRIAIDALGISQPGGGRSATLNLLEPLLQIDKENEYLLFLDRQEPTLPPGENVRTILAPTRQRFAVRAWAQATWPNLLRRERVDLIHHTKNLVTFLNPCPTAVTIHDLTILVHPEIFPRVDVLYWRTVEKLAVNSVDRVIAVSDVTAADVIHFYGTPQERVVVIYEGIDEAFRPAAPEQIAEVRMRYGLPERYLLHVGSISLKKNLATLARAYGRLVREENFDGALVLVGRSYWEGGDRALDAYIAEQTANRSAGAVRIIRTGPVPQGDLPALYSGATCFVFPSLHEGFGLVPLEAAACGTPVVSSRVGVMEQLLEGVALFLQDPHDEAHLAETLASLLADPARLSEMRAAGLAAAPRWSRRRAAQETLALYKTLASGTNPPKE
ncbi:MAG: glycosyltransferase family 4 protein [Chloroflexi bacterium]|nr:glycosyltransferase family 4 protein [Chloroflexota bacterium]